jgi:hypothetical protein
VKSTKPTNPSPSQRGKGPGKFTPRPPVPGSLEAAAEQAPGERAVDDELPPKRMKTSLVSVRVDEPTLERLERFAKERGVGVSTLIRMWTLQRLASELPDDEDPWV